MFGAGALLALAVCGAAFLTRPGEIGASAVAKPSLFLPGSYEEYLPLERPSDAAMSEEYVAVADGGTLYVYDRAEGVYSYYLHEVNGTERPISALGFTEDGTLFFSDRDTQLYRYDIAEGRAVLQAGIPSSTFLIEGDTGCAQTLHGGHEIRRSDVAARTVAHVKPVVLDAPEQGDFAVG